MSCLEGLTENEHRFLAWLWAVWAAGGMATAFGGGKGGKAEERGTAVVLAAAPGRAGLQTASGNSHTL